MTEPDSAPASDQQSAEGQEPETFSRDYVEQLRKENAKYRTRATELDVAAKAAEKARLAAMTDSERAVAEAEKRGAQSAAQQFASRLVRAEFTQLARGRNPGYDAAVVLDDLNLARYVNDDGEPDLKALSAAVERLVPAPERNPRPTGNADLGARDSGRPQDMNALIRSRLRG